MTGGILIDDGWIRILVPEMKNATCSPDWNKENHL